MGRKYVENYDEDYDDDDDDDDSDEYDKHRDYGSDHYTDYNTDSETDYRREYKYRINITQVYGIEACSSNVPKLTDMASFTVALALWNDNGPHRRRSIHTQKECTLESIEELRLPGQISKPIAGYVFKIYCEFKYWSSYFYSNEIDQIYLNHCHDTIWHPSGIINIKETARNLINLPELDDYDKYCLSCAYCLKDELESMWPSFVSNNLFDDGKKSYLIHNELNCYWYFYFRNELDQLEPNENQSVASYMFEHRYVNNWPAKEYFFGIMTPEEQIQATIWCIDKSYAMEQKVLLRKLNEGQRLHVYMSRAAKIIKNYVAGSQDNEIDIRTTWFIIRNLITREDFATIFKSLLECESLDGSLLEDIWSSTSDDYRSHFLDDNPGEVIGGVLSSIAHKNRNDFFLEILSKFSTNIKQNITKKQIFIRCCVDLLRNDKLLLFDRLLNFCCFKPEGRGRIKRDIVKDQDFGRYCKCLLIQDRLELFERLLDLLLDGKEESIKFKKNLRKMGFFDLSQHCEELLIDEKFQQFERLLNSFIARLKQPLFGKVLLTRSKRIRNYCLRCYMDEKRGCLRLNNLLSSLLPSSPDIIAEYKKTLLMSSDGIDECRSVISYRETDLNPVIIDSLPTTDLVTEFKKQLIFSPCLMKTFRYWIVENRLNALNVCMARYTTSEEEKIALKKQIIRDSGDLFILIYQFSRSNPDENSWKSLEMWWPRDKDTSIDFKSIFPLDKIFNEMLKDCIYSRYDPAHYQRYCKLKLDPKFDSLDVLLNWYFESSIKKAEYKLQRMDAYSEIDAIRTLLKKKNCNYFTKSNGAYFKTIFHWIFESNFQRMEEFKAKKKGEKIVEVMRYLLSNRS